MGAICYHDIQSSNPIGINHMQRFTLPDDYLIKIGQLNLYHPYQLQHEISRDVQGLH